MSRFLRCLRLGLLAGLLFRGAVTLAADADNGPSRKVAEFMARAGNMTCVAISADSKLVLTGEDDGLVTLWSVTTGTSVQKYMGHGRTVFAAALLPDGKRAVTCGDDNQIIVWELTTGKRLLEMKTGDSTPLVMSCSAPGTLVAVGGPDGTIGVWDLTTGKRLTGMHRASGLCGLRFSPDGRWIAAGYQDGQVVLWSTSDWAAKTIIPAQDNASVGALDFSADSRTLVTGNQNGVAAAWNVAGKFGRVATFTVPLPNPPDPPGSPPFPGSTITPGDYGAVAFIHAFGAHALTAGQNQSPKLWEIRTGKLLTAFPWLTDTHFYVARYGFPFATAAVSPRGDFLVTTKDNLAQVWRLPSPPAP